MLESQHHSSSEKLKASSHFSFMKLIADFVTTLTTDEVEKSTTDNWFVYFTKEASGGLKIFNSKDSGKDVPKHSIGLRAKTIVKRSWVFENGGELEWLKELIHLEGKNNRRFLIEEISVGDPKNPETSDYSVSKMSTRNISSWSILARAKNAFKESDSVEKIIKLSAWDLMYIRFIDDSHVYSISVKDSSRLVTMKDGSWENRDVPIALCSITYEESWKEITQEGLIRLPLRRDHTMFVTSGGKKIVSLNKTIGNIKVRRRKEEAIH